MEQNDFSIPNFVAIEEIRFAANFNNKLNCISFTTLRPTDKEKYKIGNKYIICCEGRSFKASIIDIKQIKRNQLNEFIARLDTGCSLKDTLGILKSHYPESTDDSIFDFILLQRLKPSEDYYAEKI